MCYNKHKYKEVLMVRKLLITGFDPFAHYQCNPSWEVVRALPEQIGDFELSKLLNKARIMGFMLSPDSAISMSCSPVKPSARMCVPCRQNKD